MTAWITEYVHCVTATVTIYTPLFSVRKEGYANTKQSNTEAGLIVYFLFQQQSCAADAAVQCCCLRIDSTLSVVHSHTSHVLGVKVREVCRIPTMLFGLGMFYSRDFFLHRCSLLWLMSLFAVMDFCCAGILTALTVDTKCQTELRYSEN